MQAETQKQDLVISRIFNCSLEQAWSAWTDGAILKQWWGPEIFTCPLADLDLREGGIGIVGMTSAEHGEHYSRWEFQSITPMQSLEFIHNLADKAGNKLEPVTVGMPADFPVDQVHKIVFKAIDEEHTEITVTEYAWTVGFMMDMSKMGMEQCFDKLAALFASAKS